MRVVGPGSSGRHERADVLGEPGGVVEPREVAGAREARCAGVREAGRESLDGVSTTNGIVCSPRSRAGEVTDVSSSVVRSSAGSKP